MATNLSLKQHFPEGGSQRNCFLLVKNSESVYVNVYSSFLSWGGGVGARREVERGKSRGEKRKNGGRQKERMTEGWMLRCCC